MSERQQSSQEADSGPSTRFTLENAPVSAKFVKPQAVVEIVMPGERPVSVALEPKLALLAAPADEPAARPAAPGAYLRVPATAIRAEGPRLRKRLEDDDIDSLARSVAAKGIMQPLLVRRLDGAPPSYQLIAGYRRWRAASLAKLAEVPVIVLDRLSDGEALEIALIENLQRRDLTIIEEGEAYRALIQTCRHSHQQVADLVGKSRSHVSNTMRLLTLPPSVKQLIEAGGLTPGHGRALIGAPDPEEMAQRSVNEGLRVRQLERLIGSRKRARDSAVPALPAIRPIEALALTGEAHGLQSALSAHLGLRVEIDLSEPELRIRGGSPAEIVAAARQIRDALQGVCTPIALDDQTLHDGLI